MAYCFHFRRLHGRQDPFYNQRRQQQRRHQGQHTNTSNFGGQAEGKTVSDNAVTRGYFKFFNQKLEKPSTYIVFF